MATWSVTVTNKGIALQTKQVNGATISFTRVVSGSGSVSIINLKDQTTVSGIVQTLSMESLRILDDNYKITVLLSNAELTKGYNLSQIGFYATDPDEGEILFAIGQIDTPRAIPTNEDSPGYCLEFAFTFQNSNNATIEITPDMSAYVTMNVVNDIVENTKDEVSISGKGTGNPITIEDSTDAPFNDITIYGASKQIKTTGYQLVDFSAGNNTTGTTSNFENDTLTVSGDGTVPYQNWGKDITALITEHPGEIIWFDYGELKTNVSHDGSIVQLNIALNDDTNIYAQLVTISGIQRQYTIPDDTSNIKSVHLCVYTTNNTTAKANTVRIKEPMLQYGTDKKEYEPYTGRKPGPNPDYPQEIESVGDSGSVIINTTGKNLFNCRDVVEGSLYNSAVIADDDFVTLECDNLEGTTTAYKNYWTHICKNLKKDTDYRIVVEVKTLVNCGLYAVSGKTPNTTESQFDENLVIQQVGTFSQVIHTNDADWTGTVYALRTFAQFSPGASGKCVFRISLQQTEDTSTNYEPYKESTATVPLANPLYGTSTIGFSGIKNKFASITFDGSDDEGWRLDNTSDDTKKRMVTSAIKDLVKKTENNQFANIWCTMFLKVKADDTYTKHDGISVDDLGRVHIYSETYNDAVKDWCAFLANNPMTVIYELAEPLTEELTDEQITALQSLLTFEPITNIFSDDLATLDVEYFKNTENGKAMATLKNENIELRKLIGDVNTVLEGLIGGA